MIHFHLRFTASRNTNRTWANELGFVYPIHSSSMLHIGIF